MPRNRIDKPSEGNFDSLFSYTAETIRSRFLTEIRENKKIVVTKCPNCGMVCYPLKPPFIFGMIRLDGADNGWIHMIGDVNPKDMKTGKVAEVKFIKIL